MKNRKYFHTLNLKDGTKKYISSHLIGSISYFDEKTKNFYIKFSSCTFFMKSNYVWKEV